MSAWGSGSCSLHSRIPSIQDGRQGVWKEKGGAGGRTRSLEERSAAASPSRSPGPGRRVEGQLAGARVRRGRREAGGVREGVRRRARPRKGSQKGGKGRERAREEGGGGQRNLRRAMCRYWELALSGFLSVRGGGGSGLFLSCFFLPSSFSTRRHGLYFSFRNTI